MAADHFCLRWNNYQSNMVSELESLRSDEDLVDVTLSCEGHLLKAHKVILSACSSYFRNVFKDNPCKHPVVILKDVSYEDVEALLSFVYQGVVYISEKKLSSFLLTAELLQIRGLTGAATTMKESPQTDSAAVQNRLTEKNSVPPPPQLLTANVINSWKHQTTLNTVGNSVKSESSNPSSPVPAAKRKKYMPGKFFKKDNDCSDTNSNQDYSESESENQVKSQDFPDRDQLVESKDDFSNSVDDREDCSRETNPSFYDTLDSDEADDEAVDCKKSTLNSSQLSNTPGSGSLNPLNSGNSSSVQSPGELNSGSGDTRLGRRPCPLCQKIISNKSNLLKHMRIRHSDEHNPAGCTICNKVFKNKYSLRAHINIYHKDAGISSGAVNLQLSAYSQRASDFNTQQPLFSSSSCSSAGHSSNYTSVSTAFCDEVSSYQQVKGDVLHQFSMSNLPLI